MKTGTIKYSAEFKTLDGNRWLGIEMEYDMNTDNPIEVFNKAEDTINTFARSRGLLIDITPQYPPSGWLPSINQPLREIQVEKDDKEVGDPIKEILSAPDLKELETYRWQINKNPELERAYILRYDELTNKQ